MHGCVDGRRAGVLSSRSRSRTRDLFHPHRRRPKWRRPRSSSTIPSRSPTTRPGSGSSARRASRWPPSRGSRSSRSRRRRSPRWRARPCASASSSCAREHNEQVARILSDPEASQNDKGVALAFLRNAEIAARGELPICQDTGTATVVAKKGQGVWTGVRDEEFISQGIWETYQQQNLRYSQTSALTLYEEKNTGDNLPAQVDLYATPGAEYKFLFVAKGGGSANKTMLWQETKALLNPATLEKFLVDKMKYLGHRGLPAVPHRHRHRRHLGRGLPEDGEAGLHQVLRRPAHHGRRRRPGLPRRGAGAEAAGGRQQAGHRRPVRRQVLRPRRPGGAPAAPRRLLPGGHGRLLLGRPQHQGQDRQGRALARGPGPRSRPPHPGRLQDRQARARRQGRPQPAHEGDPGRAVEAPGLHAAAPQRDAGGGARHRPRQVQGADRRRQGRAAVPQGPPGLLRRPGQDAARGSPRAPSARPPPGAWTPTWTCCSRTGPRW